MWEKRAAETKTNASVENVLQSQKPYKQKKQVRISVPVGGAKCFWIYGKHIYNMNGGKCGFLIRAVSSFYHKSKSMGYKRSHINENRDSCLYSSEYLWIITSGVTYLCRVSCQGLWHKMFVDLFFLFCISLSVLIVCVAVVVLSIVLLFVCYMRIK